MANNYTVLDKSSLGSGSSTNLSDNKQPIKLTDKADTCVVVAEATGDANASSDVRVHLRGSIDDSDYTTVDIGGSQTGYFDIPVTGDAGNKVRAIASFDYAWPYLKVIAENLDSTYTASDVLVKASIKAQDVE